MREIPRARGRTGNWRDGSEIESATCPIVPAGRGLDCRELRTWSDPDGTATAVERAFAVPPLSYRFNHPAPRPLLGTSPKTSWKVTESCRYKGHLHLAGEQGSKSDYELLMRESRDRVRLAATTLLLDRNKDGEGLAEPHPVACGAEGRRVLVLDATGRRNLSICFDALHRTAGAWTR